MEFYRQALRQYSDFSGRATREQYWMFQLINILIMIVPLVLFMTSLGGLEAGGDMSMISKIALGILVLYSLFIFIPSLAISIRRLHDSGKSGWFYLIGLIPFGSIVLLVFFCLDSERITNKWGPSTKYGDGLAGNVIDQLVD